MQWAFARIGRKWDDATLVSVHGRARDGSSTLQPRSVLSAISSRLEGDFTQTLVEGPRVAALAVVIGR